MSSETFKIRPAGRHILTIGRDLIQDPYAAIVELVKNAYDADATRVNICFEKKDGSSLQIIVGDDGHGMSRDVVTSKWMVPSTNDKEKRKISPKGRIMQGRKGIGRYASAMLGNELFLETISKETKQKTSLYVNWDAFEKEEYLSDVDIPIESTESTSESGTVLTIKGNVDYLNEWNDKQFTRLEKELRKLMTPIEKNKGAEDSKFNIFLTVTGFPGFDFSNKKIEPFPLFDLYDYRIQGKVHENGKGVLTYDMQKVRNSVPQIINFDFESKTNCGSVEFDIRVFDREKEAIDDLIKRGLKDDHGSYVGKLEARQLLNENNGIGVYRNGFRIRPLGDPDFDWIELNRKRIQNPSLKIGSDQVIGIVNIESEEKSGLIEKSARDGLKENQSYKKLIELTQKVIEKLETQRFIYRSKAGISRKPLKVESEIERLYSFDSLKRKLQLTLKKGNVSDSVSKNVISAVEEDQKEKNKIADALRETIAIYQGQATVGKIINVVLHEGRKPLEFFNEQVPLFKSYYKKYCEGDTSKLPQIYVKIDNFSLNSNILVQLFKKINPLAMGRRSAKQKINFIECLRSVFMVFSSQLKDISWNVMCSTGQDVIIECWRQDVYSVFTNLIENSLYWMNEKNSPNKKIDISVVVEKNEISVIDYRDSGPGIEMSLLENDIIFEPDFSTKPDGTGLGLSIAGESAKRLGFKLKALPSNDGAYFRMERELEESC